MGETNKPCRKAGSTSCSLIEHLVENRSDAWKRLYQLYDPLIRFWCHQYGVDQQDMGDVVQDVFKTLAENMATFRKDKPGDSFRGWLKTIVRSRSIDWHRRQAKGPKAIGGSQANHWLFQQLIVEEPSESDALDSQIEQKLTQQIYLRALQIIREQGCQRC